MTAKDVVRVSEALVKGASTLTLAVLGPQKGLPGYEKVADRLAA